MSDTAFFNLCINKGATYGPKVFRFRNQSDQSLLDFTGLNARSTIRASFTGVIIAQIDCSIPTPTNGEIWISIDSDVITADNISPQNILQIENWETRTEPLTLDELKLFNSRNPYVWDLETFDSSDPPIVKRRIHGLVAVTSESTYPEA